MGQPAIETIDLVKRYPLRTKGRGGSRKLFKAIFGIDSGKVLALDGVSLRVEKGEIFGLLGPNGAGKTTLIRILSTLVIHDEGEAYVNGVDVRKRPEEVLRNLQTVLSGSKGVEWRVSARQALEFYAALYGLTKDDARTRIERILEFTELREVENVMFQRYSTGMARRLLMGRALLLDVPILLFDEPSANLDPKSAMKFRRLIEDVSRKEGRTVLIATHNMYEAQQMCDRIAIIDHGKIIAIGTPNEVRRLVSQKVTVSVELFPGAQPVEESVIRQFGTMNKVVRVYVSPGGGSSQKLTIDAEPDFEMQELLHVIISTGARVKSIDTTYPSLEEAFMLLTEAKRQ